MKVVVMLRGIGSRMVAGVLWAWRELTSAVEWHSHADRIRPPLSERGDIEDPKLGWSVPDAATTQERHRTQD